VRGAVGGWKPGTRMLATPARRRRCPPRGARHTHGGGGGARADRDVHSARRSRRASTQTQTSSWLVVVTVAPVRPASVRAHLSFLPPPANVSLHEWLETTIRASHLFFLLRRGDGQMEMSIKVLHEDDRHIQSCRVVSC